MEGVFTSDDVWTERDNQILSDFLGEADLEHPSWAVFATARLPHKSPNQIMGHCMSLLMDEGSSGSGGPPPLPTGNSSTPHQLVPQGESSHGLAGSGLLSSVFMTTPLSNPMAVPVAAPSPVLSDYGLSSFYTQSPPSPTFDPSSLLATSPGFSDFGPSSFPMTTPCLSTTYPSSNLAPPPVFSDLGSSKLLTTSPCLSTINPSSFLARSPAFSELGFSSFSTPSPALPTSAPTQALSTLAQTQALPTTFAQTESLTTYAQTPALPTLNSSTHSTPPLGLFDYGSSSRTPSPPATQTFDPSTFLTDSPPFPTFDPSPFMAPPSPLFPTFDPLPSLSPSQAPPTFDPSPFLAPSQPPASRDFDPSPSMAPPPSLLTFNQMAPSFGVTSMRENSALVIEDNPVYPQSTIDLDMLELGRVFNVEGTSEQQPAMAQASGQYEVLVPNEEEVARSQSVMVQPQPMTVRSRGTRVERAKLQAPPAAVRQVRQRKKNVQSSQKCGAPVAKGVSTRGLPWNEDEHRLFLLGLDVYGRGHWTKIARNFVLTRNPIQVASHAQKFFNRSVESRQKRRPSILDIRSNDGPTVRQPRKPLSIYDIAQWNKSFRFPPINAYQTSIANVPQQPVNNGTILEHPQVTQASVSNVIHVEEAVGPSSSTDRKGKQPIVADR